MKTFRQFLTEAKQIKEAKINSFSDEIMLETFGMDLFVRVVDNFKDVVIRLGNKDYKINDKDLINPIKKNIGSKLSDKEISKLADEYGEKLEKEEKDVFNEIMKVAQKFDDEVAKIIKKHNGKI